MSSYSWRNHKIYGHAINDSPVPIRYPDGTKCIHYSLWNSVMERCFSEKFHKKQPAYIGTTAEQSWVKFMGFKPWSVEAGLTIENKSILQIDKDILSIDGNKHYSPDTCCLVPRQVNNVLIDRFASQERTAPMGSHYSKRDKVYIACVNHIELGGNSKRIRLGVSEDPMIAHKMFQLGKAQEIENRIAWWKVMDAQDSNYMFQQRVADALMLRAEKLRQDAADGVETFKI